MGSIFLSHNHKDKTFVRKLGKELSNSGIKVWIDEAEMFVGDSLIKKITTGIEEMEYLGVIISKNSINSKWVEKEVEIALTEEINNKRVIVLPILLDDVDLPIFLMDKIYADFRNVNNYNNALLDLIRSIKRNNKSNLFDKSEDEIRMNSSNILLTNNNVESTCDSNGKNIKQKTYKNNKIKLGEVNRFSNINGSKLKELFKLSEKQRSQIELAKIFSVSQRSINNWIKTNKRFKKYEATLIREFFIDTILLKKIKKLILNVFKIIPCEVICVWIVADYNQSIIQLENSFFNYFEYSKHGKFSVSPMQQKSINEGFMSTWPIKSGEIVCLNGDEISNIKKKRIPGRTSNLLNDGICESLMKIPVFIPSLRGPNPIAVISLENKLKKNSYEEYEVINNEYPIFTANDIEKAYKIAKLTEEELLKYLKLLETFRDSSEY